MLRVNEFRTNLKSYSDLVDYAAMRENGVVQGKSAALVAAWWVEGEDLGSASAEQLYATTERVNDILKKLDTGWMINSDLIRIPAIDYPDSTWPDRTTRQIDRERRAQFQAEGAHFETITTFVLTYTPPLRVESTMSERLITRPDGKREEPSARVMAYYKTTISTVERALTGTVKMNRMKTDEYGYDDLLQYLHYCATFKNHPMLLPHTPMYLDWLIASEDFFGGLELRIGEKHVRCVAITGFPSESYPAMMDTLGALPFPLRWSTRFILMSQTEAVNLIGKWRKLWKQQIRGFKDQLFQTQSGSVNMNALSHAADAELAASEAQGLPVDANGTTVRFGFYTAVVVIEDEDKERAEDHAKEVMKLINNLGFSCRIETVNAMESFLGTLPGHATPNVRRPIMHTLNLAHMLPLTSIWSGPAEHPCPFYPPKSPPLFWARTTGSTPFHPTLHVGDVGHTLILGPTGAGKSSFLGLIAASQFRYEGAKVYCFDKGRSMFALNQATGGEHYEVGHDGGLKFAPLADVTADNMKARIWAEEWVEGLLILQNVTINPEVRNQIHEAIIRHGNSEDKSMTAFASAVQDKALRQALKYYTLDSPGELLDGANDSVKTMDNPFQVYEMEELLEKGEAVVVPTLEYLFHRVTESLDGSPVLIIIDEAWVAIQHPVFAARIRQWLKELRKAAANVVFSTQSVADVNDSPLKAVLMESCPTKIYLANPEARSQIVQATYQSFGLTDTQINIISRMTPKRDYYYTSPLGKRVFDLGLGPVALSFVGASGKKDIADIRALIKQYGQAWPAEWLRARGFDKAAAEWAA
jgi:type IV secretion system protein VirB4